MKVKKTGFIVLLCFAAAFLITGVVLFLIPAPKSPIIMSEKITVVRNSGRYEWRGKIKNDTDKDIELNRFNFVVTVKTSGGDNYYSSDYWFVDGPIVLAPSEEYDLSTKEFMTDSDRTPSKVTKVLVIVDNVNYYLIGSPLQNRCRGFAIISLAVTVVFVICAVAVLRNGKKQAERYKAYETLVASLPNNGILINGFLSRKGDKKKAVAKSALSALGGAISAIFLGAGFYKVYSSSNPKEFILTDDALYVNDPNSGNTSLDAMTRLDGAALPQPTVAVNKKLVTMTSADGELVFSFPYKNCGLTAEQLVAKLNATFAKRPDAAAAPTASVFDGIDDNAAHATLDTAAAPDTVEPATTSTDEKSDEQAPPVDNQDR